MSKPPVSRPLIASLAILSMAGPLATDMYLPGFPEMRDDLSAPSSLVQVTLTSFMIGMAVGQLFWGPLSDRFGRRGPLLFATTAFVLTSALAAMSGSIWLIIVFRLIQGFAGSAGVVISRAIARDLADGAQLARLFSLIGVVISLAPIAAPIVGGLLDNVIGWRGVMWVIFLVAILMAACAYFFVPESLPTEARSDGGFLSLRTDVVTVVRDIPFLGYTAAAVFGFGVVFTFISSSSVVYQDIYGMSNVEFTLFFAINGLGTLAMGLVNTRLVSRVSSRTLLSIALAIMLVGSAVMAAASVLWQPISLWMLVPLLLITTSMNPLVMANASTLGLSRHGRAAGMASALMGTFQFAIAGAVAPMVTITGQVSLTSMGVVMMICAAIALIGFAVTRQGRTQTPA